MIPVLVKMWAMGTGRVVSGPLACLSRVALLLLLLPRLFSAPHERSELERFGLFPDRLRPETPACQAAHGVGYEFEVFGLVPTSLPDGHLQCCKALHERVSEGCETSFAEVIYGLCNRPHLSGLSRADRLGGMNLWKT